MIAPEHTAVRVALWRALHLEVDAPPPIFSDALGAQLVGDSDWRQRPDMDPAFSRPMRASIVGRARFVDDLVDAEIRAGVEQYVILGAGLDTFAQRRPELAERLCVYEVDQPGPQAWKKKRLTELGFSLPSHLRFVPVDFEKGETWWDGIEAAGFRRSLPAIFVSTGVSMYLSEEANQATLRQIASLSPGTTFAMTFLLALERLEGKEREVMELVMKRAAASGTPFRSLFTPEKITDMAKSAGFASARYLSAGEIHEKYFSQRQDGLSAGHAEAFLLAAT